MRRRLTLVFIFLLLLGTQACGDTPRQFNPLPTALGDLRGVALGFERLESLADSQGGYVAWLNLENRDIIGLGTFDVNSDGRPINSNGEVIERFTAGESLFSAVSVVITIETGGQAGVAPLGVAILQGPFINGVAQLSVPAPLLIEESFGAYRVFTPTDGPDTNEGSGVWATSEEGGPLLGLPPLNSIYSYEHYMIIDGQTLTMGRFTSPILPDFICRFCGPLDEPLYPGEDFLFNAPPGLTFPADLSGATLLVTLEPILADSADPSQLVVLEAVLPAGVQGGEVITLTNQTANFPIGTAAIF